MYKGLIVSGDSILQSECKSVINSIGEIRVDIINKAEQIVFESNLFDYLFIIISDFSDELIAKITQAQIKMPGLSVLFYNQSLNISRFPSPVSNSKIHMIIGDNRRNNLKIHIEGLRSKFWRKIPFRKLDINFDKLSPRMKMVMNYIETTPIKDCNINTIASFLNLSAGYLSQEFKKEINKSFREFMQNIISYYENIIFSKVNLSAKNISQILGYSEPSSFSRSFKKRKGMSPSKFKKTIV